MNIISIKEKLHSYVENGDPKKIKAFYSMVEDEIQENSIWDPAFTKEMDKRRIELETGKVKGHTLEEMIRDARKKVKKRK
ncbi:MAG: hypothetical protein IPJ81_04375 [Chitinophagaceae bacterium]|nr:hypothetical protein [Chitinophagaceae bacterium]